MYFSGELIVDLLLFGKGVSECWTAQKAVFLLIVCGDVECRGRYPKNKMVVYNSSKEKKI